MSLPPAPPAPVVSDGSDLVTDAVDFVAAVRSQLGVDSPPFAAFLAVLREFKAAQLTPAMASEKIRDTIKEHDTLTRRFDLLIHTLSPSTVFLVALGHVAVLHQDVAAESDLPPLKFAGLMVNPLDPSEGAWCDLTLPSRAASLPVMDEPRAFDAVDGDWSFYLQLLTESMDSYDEAYVDGIERSIESHEVHEFWLRTYAITNIALCLQLPALVEIVRPMRDLGRRMRDYSRDSDAPCNFPVHGSKFPYPLAVADILARLQLCQIRLMPALRAEMSRYRALVPRIRVLDAFQRQTQEMQAEADQLAHVQMDAPALAS